MDLEEKENSDTIRQLNLRFKLLKEQKEKYRKKAELKIEDLETSLK